MALFDFILNLAALLLWLSWCSRRADPLTRSAPATLIGTVKRAEPRATSGWFLLAALAGLLLARALFYHQVASAIGWTPRLDLGVVVLAFRSDLPGSVLLYSALSFGRVLIVWYFWLLTLVVINRAVLEPDPLQKLIMAQVGGVRSWPWPLLVLLPPVLVVALWFLLHPVLRWAGVVTPPQVTAHLVEQGSLLTLTLVFSLKYLLPVFLVLHLLASYVYLGKSPVWDFISTTSRNILKPLRALPLRIAKVDLAPVTGAILILFLLHWLPNIIQSELGRRSVAIWPQ